MYRVGIIGTGRIASTIQDELDDLPLSILLPYSHAGAYTEHPGTEVVAAADPSPERLAAFGQRWGVTALYPDFRQMLEQEPLDIVSVCTPTRNHVDVVTVVIDSGVKGIFMEKPVTPTLREADALIGAAEARGVATVVNHVRTFDPYYRRVRELIRAGWIGKPIDVMARWAEGMSFGGSHLFDLVRFLFDTEATWVFGRLDGHEGPFDPGGSGIVGFANGMQLFLNNEAGQAAPKELDIAGDAGRIRIGDLLPPQLYRRNPETSFGELLQHPFPGSVVGKSAMTVAVDELVDAMRAGSTPASTIRDGRANLEIAVAFHLSHRAGAPVTLPLPESALDVLVDDPWGRTATS